MRMWSIVVVVTAAASLSNNSFGDGIISASTSANPLALA